MSNGLHLHFSHTVSGPGSIVRAQLFGYVRRFVYIHTRLKELGRRAYMGKSVGVYKCM